MLIDLWETEDEEQRKSTKEYKTTTVIMMIDIFYYFVCLLFEFKNAFHTISLEDKLLLPITRRLFLYCYRREIVGGKN